jgi:nucleotide-binding universal stress UspA family protein
MSAMMSRLNSAARSHYQRGADARPRRRGGRPRFPLVERILVAINGLEHSLAAGDVAAYLAKAANAELVLFNVRHLTRESRVRQDPERRGLMEAAGYRTLREATSRFAPLGVRVSMHVELGEHPGAAIVRELQRRPYQLVVLGAIDRGADGHIDLGGSVPTVLTQSRTPAVLLVSDEA